MACLTHSDSAIQRDAALVLSNVATHDACRTLLLQEPTLVPCLQVCFVCLLYVVICGYSHT